MLSWFDAFGDDGHIVAPMAFPNQQQRRMEQAALERWRADIQQRMAQADNPLTVTEEQKADVWEALVAHANDKLPEGHPAKITRADVGHLLRLQGELRDLVQGEAIAAKLLRILPPLPESA